METSSQKTKRRNYVGRILLTVAGLVVAAIFLFIVAPLTWWSITAPEYDGYNYYTFKQIEGNDNYIEAGQLFPGDQEVFTVDGEAVQLQSLWQDKPLVLETGSRSCPLYWSSEESMSALANSYADKANIVVLYTREAHPGLLARPPRDLSDKLEGAQQLEAGLKQTVLVDEVSGAFHNTLGGGSNSVYIIGTDGIVTHYAYWNNPDITKEQLDALLAAGGTSDSLNVHTNPCRDLTKARDGFTAETARNMMMGIIKVGGIDALVDFMMFMMTAEGGEDPFCEGVSEES